MHILRCYAEDSIGYKLQRNKTEEGNYTMLENLNSYLDDPIDGNKQDDEVEIDLLEIFNVLKSKFLILPTAVFWRFLYRIQIRSRQRRS